MKKAISIVSLLAVVIILGAALNGCSGDDVITQNNNNSDTTTCTECIVCNDYEVGEIFSINGVTYMVADREMLDEAYAKSYKIENGIQVLVKGEDLSKYCTSKVTDMAGMFFAITPAGSPFNQDISKWDVSNVTEMQHMFQWASSFNQDIGNWDVSNVTDMSGMFDVASSFNQDLTNWCVSKIDKEPFEFSTESGLSPENHPVWGTCPE